MYNNIQQQYKKPAKEQKYKPEVIAIMENTLEFERSKQRYFHVLRNYMETNTDMLKPLWDKAFEVAATRVADTRQVKAQAQKLYILKLAHCAGIPVQYATLFSEQKGNSRIFQDPHIQKNFDLAISKSHIRNVIDIIDFTGKGK